VGFWQDVPGGVRRHGVPGYIKEDVFLGPLTRWTVASWHGGDGRREFSDEERADMTLVVVGVVLVLVAVLVACVGRVLSSRGWNLESPERGVGIAPTGRPLPRRDDSGERASGEGDRL
jgi:hypothetical protein